MTRDQIKKWEDEAHNYADHVTANDPDADWNAVFHERFAQLARADERERIAKHFEKLNGTEWFAENVADGIRAMKDEE